MMSNTNEILLKIISRALGNYAVSRGISFNYDNTPLSIEETFSEDGGLILFMCEAKTLYESIFNEEYVSSIIEYNRESSFPLQIIKKEHESFFDFIPYLSSARNFECVLIFSIHALIELNKSYDCKHLPLDELHHRFFNQYVKNSS